MTSVIGILLPQQERYLNTSIILRLLGFELRLDQLFFKPHFVAVSLQLAGGFEELVELGLRFVRFLLYYQMIKHAFGIQHSNPNALDRVYFSILLDDVSDSDAKYEYFRGKLSGITDLAPFRGSNTFIPRAQIGQVDSKQHNIPQGLDIVLGSMYFRLNDLQKSKPEGAHRRGRRTIAKEALDKEINRQIRQGYPNFNIGASTGTANGLSDRWSHNYRHWRFRPSQFQIDQSAVKGKAPHEYY